MSIASRVRLFKIGRCVWIPFWETGKWIPISGTVKHVTRGKIHVWFSSGFRAFSPNDRSMSLTEPECQEICDLLNERENKEKGV